jgi:hypothetical protein
MKTVEPAKFRIAGKIFNPAEIRIFISVAEDPSHMGPPESEPLWRVNILLLIGMLMMMAMMRCPPEWSFLNGRTSNPG